jgi:hypothetical protein
VIHLSPQADVNLNKNLILQELTPRLSDSVKLGQNSLILGILGPSQDNPDSMRRDSVLGDRDRAQESVLAPGRCCSASMVADGRWEAQAAAHP